MFIAKVTEAQPLFNRDIETPFQSLYFRVKATFEDWNLVCGGIIPVSFKNVIVKVKIPNTAEDISPISDLTLYELCSGLHVLEKFLKLECVEGQQHIVIEIPIGMGGNLDLSFERKATMTVRITGGLEIDVYAIPSFETGKFFFRYERFDITGGVRDFSVSTHIGLAIPKEDVSKIVEIDKFYANGKVIGLEVDEVRLQSSLLPFVSVSGVDGRTVVGSSDFVIISTMGIYQLRVKPNAPFTFIMVNHKSI